MQRWIVPTLFCAFLLAAAAPAQGQSLAERLAAVRKQREAERADLRVELLRKLFHRTLAVDFDGTPVRDVIDYLETALGIPIVGRYLDDPAGHGIDPAAPVTLKADKMPAVQVLDVALEQCAGDEPCTWQLRRSFVEVGTKERLAAPAAQEVRIYPIDDLLFEPPDFEDAPDVGIVGYPYDAASGYGYGGRYGRGFAGHRGVAGYSGSIRVRPATAAPEGKEARARALIEMIIESIEPEGWTDAGGTWASIRYVSGALIVKAPDFIHRQLDGYPPVAAE